MQQLVEKQQLLLYQFQAHSAQESTRSSLRKSYNLACISPNVRFLEVPQDLHQLLDIAIKPILETPSKKYMMQIQRLWKFNAALDKDQERLR